MTNRIPGSYRAVDWRWKHVQEMRSRSFVMLDSCFASNYFNSDPYLQLAYELLLLLEKDELRLIRAIQRKKVRRELKYALTAYGLQNKCGLTNCIFQAIVLADAPVEVSTALLARDELYIDIHAALFFDVADRVEDETYIWNHAIKTDSRCGLSSSNATTILLECAYLGGWQRFLTLLAAIVQNFSAQLRASPWSSCPVLAPYFKPGKPSGLVHDVIQRRMRPDAGRTIDGLRKLYLSIPIVHGGVDAHPPAKPQSPWCSDQASTFYGIVDERRLSADIPRN